MTVNLNVPQLQPGKLTDGDFPPSRPAEACTEIGCDIDDDAGEWHAASLLDVMPLRAFTLVAAAAALAWSLVP